MFKIERFYCILDKKQYENKYSKLILFKNKN